MSEVKFKGIGWISKIQKRKHTFFISISKLIAIGNMLDSKEKVYSYLAKKDDRDVIVIYLDGKPKCKKEVKLIDYNTFLH